MKTPCRVVWAMAAAFVLQISGLQGQTLVDAQRFSESSPIGSARSQAMSGAFSAVGADPSSAALNSAGLGLYRRSNLSLTPAIQLYNTKAGMWDETGRSGSTNFGIVNGGAVFTANIRSGKALNALVFGATVNQLENYYRKTDLTAFNPHNSFTTAIARYAEKYGSRGYESVFAPPNADNFSPNEVDILAINTGWAAGNGLDAPIAVIDNKVDENGNYITNQYFGAFEYGNVRQRLQWEEKGRSNQWNLSVAANFNNKLYFGVSLGIADVNYESYQTITENDINNIYRANVADTMAADQVGITNSLKTKGSGINANFGVIYQPIDMFRFGLSFQTPTLMYLTDRYATGVNIKADGSDQVRENQSYEAVYEYNLTTPYKLTLGGMFLIPGKLGLISADFDLTDYRTASFRDKANDNDEYFSNLNREIQNQFALGYNFRVGAELRYKSFYLRGGYGYFSQVLDGQNAENAKTKVSATKQSISGGLGFRTKRLNIDLAYVHLMRPENLLLYATPANSPYLNANKTLGNLLFTFGFSFGGAAEE